MTDHRLKGLGTALITPFDKEGKVDYKALDSLLEIQIDGRVDYIVVLGTTGEAVTLTPDEHRAVRTHIVEKIAGRIPLVLGLGGNNTAEVLQRIRDWSEELKRDYAAILSVCPYYNKPTQEGLFRHFDAIAKASPVPVILYNVPGRTGVNLQPETVMRIYNANPHNICGVKEASGNVEQIKHLIELSSQTGLLVISGDDGIACELMQAGAAGLISVASNAFPKEFGAIVREKNEALQKQFDETVRLLFKDGNPAGIKTVLAQKGLIENELRLPLVPCSEEVQHALAQILKQGK